MRAVVGRVQLAAEAAPPSRRALPSGGNSDAARSTMARSIARPQVGDAPGPAPEMRSSSAGDRRTGNHAASGRVRRRSIRAPRDRRSPSRQAIAPVGDAGRRGDAAETGRCDESERRRAGCRCRRARRRRSARTAAGAAPRCRDRSRGRTGSTSPSAPAVPRQRDRALDEQLIPVRVAVRLRRVDAGVAREAEHRRDRRAARCARASAAPVSARIMSHGGLPITASKPACGRRRAVGDRRTLPGTRAPSERAAASSPIASAASR